MTTTLAQVDWVRAVAQLPAFDALPPACRAALARFRCPGEPPPDLALRQEMLDRGLLSEVQGTLAVAATCADIQALAQLGWRTARCAFGSSAGGVAYQRDIWGFSIPQVISSLFYTTGQSWGATDLFDACAADGLTSTLAMVVRRWDWGIAGQVTPPPPDLQRSNRLQRECLAALRQTLGVTSAPTLATFCEACSGGAAYCLAWTVRNLALFPGFDPATARITLGLHPTTYAQRQRPDATVPADCDGAPGSAVPFRLDDAAAILAEAAVTPIKIRQDGAIAVRDHERMRARLDTLADAVPPQALGPDRLTCALILVQVRGLLGHRAYDPSMKITPAGTAFLALSPGERLRQTLAWLRPTLHTVESHDQESHLRILGWCGGPSQACFRHAEPTVLRAASKGLLQLGHAAWRLDQALAWWARQADLFPLPHRSVSEERAWVTDLEQVLLHCFLPLGLITLSGPPDQLVLRLTDAGRWMVGQTKSWTPPVVVRTERPLIVQADHTLILLAPDTALEVELARFAERCPGASGTGCLFRLTKAAALNAALAGLAGPAALAVLTTASAKPIPANVAKELLAWFATARTARVSTETLVTAPDEATALHIATLAGPPARCLTPTIIALGPPRSLAALNRKLRKHGISLDLGADPE